MKTIRIYDSNQGSLEVDLKEILSFLDIEGRLSQWTVCEVEASDEEFFSTGEGSKALSELVETGERISGDKLLSIARKTTQVIWGEFKAYKDKESPTPWLIAKAIDSTFWEVQSLDQFLLDKIANKCKNVKILY